MPVHHFAASSGRSLQKTDFSFLGLLSAGHVSSLDPETGKVTVHLTHDGSMLGSASAGIKFGNHVVMSSWVDDGVLFCPLE